ncbi:MAG: type II toxin-antitoxin system RatA family toxin [Rhodospirillaceae bacterium]|jgi:coenzyme Q-binding protein COQ10|nr:type II toxin-antitoxin system RatA family toxin [Rhodospirillaceae bacterium]MBT5567195.1 type II toxin-antitoxin system RatA family toxin [Rhodospirillaceae bacterium]MBT6089408.1 type II toxin-antitoxin system RatA family toxin [Rhodospirillaceae bacterium]MBT7449920.1 type II toxin-antitoxin system RatA family toxin [Rhodospirillaceae bacterium]
MAVHNEKRTLPYTQEQVFELVADVERYPQFLPWCIACRKTKPFDDGFEADLAIGFKMVRETFTSRVILSKADRVDVVYKDGPFKHLSNTWKFSPTLDGKGCDIDFHLDFEFRSVLLQKLIGVLFEEAVRRMVSAFESRAADLYS